MNSAYKVVNLFEQEVAAYAGARYGIATDSCTNALFLALYYLWHCASDTPCSLAVDAPEVWIPAHTYLSVPMAAVHAGGIVHFDEREWTGAYQLKPWLVWDGAKRFRKDMYYTTCPGGGFLCLSFHANKILSIGKGGMILTDDAKAVDWLKRLRYEGRRERPYKEDNIDILGWNMYMTPEQAARGLTILCSHKIGDDNPDLIEEGGYPDLRKFPVFQNDERFVWELKQEAGGERIASYEGPDV